MILQRQKDTLRTNRRTPGHSGFSLLEVLVVMAILVMITALAMPSLNRAYVGQQLVGAADVVRAGFAEARVKAIESGDIYGFFYGPGEGDYFVAPMVQGFQSIRSGVQPGVSEMILKNNITFESGDALEDSRSQAALDDATREYGSMKPVLFYPDGTSQDAVVLLQSERGDAMIQVELRGLTGTSSKSSVMDPQEARQ